MLLTKTESEERLYTAWKVPVVAGEFEPSVVAADLTWDQATETTHWERVEYNVPDQDEYVAWVVLKNGVLPEPGDIKSHIYTREEVYDSIPTVVILTGVKSEEVVLEKIMELEGAQYINIGVLGLWVNHTPNRKGDAEVKVYRGNSFTKFFKEQVIPMLLREFSYFDPKFEVDGYILSKEPGVHRLFDNSILEESK